MLMLFSNQFTNSPGQKGAKASARQERPSAGRGTLRYRACTNETVVVSLRSRRPPKKGKCKHEQRWVLVLVLVLVLILIFDFLIFDFLVFFLCLLVCWFLFFWLFGCLVVGCWLLVLGCWFLVVGSWLLVLGSWFLVLGLGV